MAPRFAYSCVMRDEPDRVRAVAPLHAAYWHDLELPGYLGGPLRGPERGANYVRSRRRIPGAPTLRRRPLRPRRPAREQLAQELDARSPVGSGLRGATAAGSRRSAIGRRSGTDHRPGPLELRSAHSRCRYRRGSYRARNTGHFPPALGQKLGKNRGGSPFWRAAS
jgi:hypothetical protein